MNRKISVTGRHLNPENVKSILAGQLTIEEEIGYFHHWKQCPECCRMLQREMSTTGFTKSASIPQAVQIHAVDANPVFYFAGDDRAILAATFAPNNLKDIISRSAGIRIDPGISVPRKNLSEQLYNYFHSGALLRRVSVNPALIKTPFMRQVLFWTWLIPFGQTATYGEVARWTGRPGAARAVGGALHSNPIPVFIPCHRVIGKNGNLTGFAGGIDLKAYLLRLEGCDIGK